MFEDFKFLNYWNAKHKIAKLTEIARRLVNDLEMKRSRMNTIEKSIKTLQDSINKVPTTRTFDCELIVHGHNPEAKEINSMYTGGRFVEVYENEILLGYAGHTAITIISGLHNIQVRFNGMIIEQQINIIQTTQEMTFEFARTEFNISSLLLFKYTRSVFLSIPAQTFNYWFLQTKQTGIHECGYHTAFHLVGESMSPGDGDAYINNGTFLSSFRATAIDELRSLIGYANYFGPTPYKEFDVCHEVVVGWAALTVLAYKMSSVPYDLDGNAV